MTNRIVFIDSNVAEYQSLISQLPVDSEVFVLNAEQDSVMEILAVLQNRIEVKAIDIICHGKPGTLIIGCGELNSANLKNYAEQLNEIGRHLNYSGDILLYGCEVAQGKIGQAFIEQMAELTGVNVAASTNLTGNADLGGNWALDAHIGLIQSSTLQLAYHGVLANFIGTPSNDVLTGSADDDNFTGGAGNDTLIGGAGNDVAIFSGNQIDYEFSLNSNGQVVVHDINTVNDDEGTDSLSGIQIIRFANGDIQNSEILSKNFRVNTISTDSYDYSSITGLNNGGFVMTWVSVGQDGDQGGIYAQRYNVNGVAQGSEFKINTYTIDSQGAPSITGLSEGGFVVTWVTFSQDSSRNGIYGQRYDSNGVAQGSEFQININTTVNINSNSTSITGLIDGGFVVTWSSVGQDGNSSGDIYAQRYDAEGIAVGDFKAVGDLALTGSVNDDHLNVAASMITSAKLLGMIGNDSYFVENVGDVVTEKTTEGIDNVNSKLTYSLSANVENLILTGTLAINGTGNDQANNITGNAAANQLNGGAGNDMLNSGAGDDILVGWSGADNMSGGLGDDTYFVENVGDLVTENSNAGTDLVSSKLTYTLPANVENLILAGTSAINGSGNNQANNLIGNGATNQLNGGEGNDTLNGGGW